jgi:hypothetical protein
MKHDRQDKPDKLHEQYKKFKNGEIGRRDFLKFLGIAGPASAMVLAAPSVAESVPAGLSEDEIAILSHLPDQQIGKKYPIGETINVGFLCALSGPDAGWGLPGLTGNNIWIDAVNKTGGLLVGGKRYPLKMHAFDDEANASKALQGARQLVLEHDVKFISAIGMRLTPRRRSRVPDNWCWNMMLNSSAPLAAILLTPPLPSSPSTRWSTLPWSPPTCILAGRTLSLAAI